MSKSNAKTFYFMQDKETLLFWDSSRAGVSKLSWKHFAELKQAVRRKDINLQDYNIYKIALCKNGVPKVEKVELTPDNDEIIIQVEKKKKVKKVCKKQKEKFESNIKPLKITNRKMLFGIKKSDGKIWKMKE